MPHGFIEPIDLSNRRTIHRETLRSLFWEIQPDDPNGSGEGRMPRFGDEGSPASLNPGRVVGNPWRRMGLHRGPKNGPAARPGHVGNGAGVPGRGGNQSGDAPIGNGATGFPGAGDQSGGHADAEFEKEAWLNRVTIDWGLCGFSIGESNAAEVAATLLFAPPRFAPTSSVMPTGPISPDAVMLTSLHIDPIIAGKGAEDALVGAAIRHLSARGIKAVEAFGCSGDGDDETKTIPREDMTLTESILHAVDGPRLPPACSSTALGGISHAAGDIIPTRVLINSGFTVVAPHPTHPRLRRELDPVLDWSAAVSEALDQLVAAQFYASLSASRSSTKL